MKTTLDCYSCFLKSALRCIRLTDASEIMQRKLMSDVLLILNDQLDNDSPLAITQKIQRHIAAETGNADPYLTIKNTCNTEAEKWIPSLREKLESADDPLLFAMKSSVIGNLMDFGIFSSFDMESMIQRLNHQEFRLEIIDFFRDQLNQSRSLTFFADNTGEIYFDALLLEYICEAYPIEHVKLVIREAPFLNDVSDPNDIPPFLLTMPEIELKTFPVDLDESTSHQWQYLVDSDIVLCKGMANFENYSNQPDFHFLLVCKCEVTAKEVCRMTDSNVEAGDWIFIKGRNT